MAETERENIRESTLEGLDTAARKGKHGGRPPVITDDMLHTVLRRRTGGETVEQIEPDLIIPTGRRNGQNPSLSRHLPGPGRTREATAYPEAVTEAHNDFAALQAPGAFRDRRREARRIRPASLGHFRAHDQSQRYILYRNYSHPVYQAGDALGGVLRATASWPDQRADHIWTNERASFAGSEQTRSSGRDAVDLV
jgi:hypothetical protein